jgi:hypothetical protein
MDALTTANKQLNIVHSNQHGILMDNIDGTWAIIDEFMKADLNLLP